MSELPELPDNEDLEPIVTKNMLIGCYSEINGSDAVACPEHVPTRHELLRLAHYWYDRIVSIQTTWFYAQQTGSYESRMLAYAGRRLDRIAEVIGQETVDKVVAEVAADYQKRMGADWEVFIHGDDEQWESVRARVRNEAKRGIG